MSNIAPEYNEVHTPIPSSRGRKIIIGFVALVVSLCILLVFFWIGDWAKRAGVGRPSSPLTNEEILSCTDSHPPTFSALLECLYQSGDRARIDTEVDRSKITERREIAGSWLENKYRMERYVPNQALSTEASDPQRVIFVVRISKDTIGSFPDGGTALGWWFFIGPNDELLGWIPP